MFLSTLDSKFFIQLSPTVTKLCHIKCDGSQTIRTLDYSYRGLFVPSWTVRTVLGLFVPWTVSQIYAILSATTQRAFRPMVDILSI